MLPVIYINVHANYRYLLECLDSGKAAWQKLKAHFNCLTMRQHITAHADSYGIIHDPELPINKYIQSLTAAQKKLKNLGCTIDNTEFIDVYLMHLNSLFHPACAYILAQKTELDLEMVKSMLVRSASADLVLIKSGLSEIVLAARGQNIQSGVHNRSDSFMDGGFKWCDLYWIYSFLLFHKDALAYHRPHSQISILLSISSFGHQPGQLSQRPSRAISSSSSSSPPNPPILISIHHIPHHSSCLNIHCLIPFTYDYTFINSLAFDHLISLNFSSLMVNFLKANRPGLLCAHVFIASHSVLILKEVFPHAGKCLPGLRVYMSLRRGHLGEHYSSKAKETPPSPATLLQACLLIAKAEKVVKAQKKIFKKGQTGENLDENQSDAHLIFLDHASPALAKKKKKKLVIQAPHPH
ncbi:hypothetical protein Hypma_001563 [Hypsizygus marmoreus]|uniref:Uncharacterized protein n=1 Tax=Hypsizygus marmoreus TaxID=39966 RepID=A0A369K3D0_HYPMA|nr:hypothetical protein Hypma_001563 [Hypsizygus marmoreus]